MDQAFIPALFGHGEQDDFIFPHHSQQLYDAYAGEKDLIFYEGEHFGDRPAHFYEKVKSFFKNCLKVDQYVKGVPIEVDKSGL